VNLALDEYDARMTLQHAEQSGPIEASSEKRVVYLFGAGATQACVAHSGSNRSLLMAALRSPIAEKARESVGEHSGVRRLANEVLDDETDVEHLLTFLDESQSQAYRDFAEKLREAFSSVLRDGLLEVQSDASPNHSGLYAALIDMHEIPGIGERLKGFLTLNYDIFLEHAILERHNLSVDYGITIDGQALLERRALPVLKLHGSFGWAHSWPIRIITLDSQDAFWIPPGIRKPKSEYPFNVIWGRARELLDCDILRIVGCNLGPNDWDLISLLFTTKHLHASSPPYDIEIISPLATARKISTLFPYLKIKSLVDLPLIGDQILSEALTIGREEYDNLTSEQRPDTDSSVDERVKNPFAYWLRQKGEVMLREVGRIDTRTRIFQDFMDSAT